MASRNTKPAKKKKYKVTIICQDTDSGRLEMEIKFSPNIPGDKPVDSQAVACATAFIKLIGEQCS